ncbi:tape measure protein [Sporosarcina cyprini]|uniref:tape measure protein n=1 Tax=Sporosarcina cyprini TaxID=2910523 RepID=UPI001EDD1995|nr:tape measure protein [Sporosarcina cyprini]MCG3089129.1 tape measure protein [Sporosarcina cyprini]
MAGNRVISAVLTLRDKDFSANAKKAGTSTKDMERKVRHANNTVTQFGRSATSSFKSIATSAAGLAGAIGITKMFSSAVGMVKSSLAGAFDRIDTMEQFKNVLEVMTGSAEKANATLEATRDIVKGTAFGLDVAAGAVQGFVTGGMEVEDATRVMGSLTDAVAFYTKGTNDELGTVTDAFIKMSTKGTVNMEQLGRVVEAGIPAVDIYAEAVGKSTAQVATEISKGKIDAKSFMDVLDEALANGTKKFPALEGAAKNAGASWSGTFGNMRAAVTRGVTGIIEKTDEMLNNNGLPSMREMVANFGSKFEGVLGKAAGAVEPVGNALISLYQKSKPGLGWIKDTAIPGVKDKIVEAYTASQPALNWLKDVAFPGVSEAVGFAVDKFTDMYNFVANNWSLIGPVVVGVAAGVAAFRVGVVAVTAAQATWKVVTSGLQIATALLNGTLAISPLGWVAIAIGAVVTAGILLWKNWDTVKEKAQSLWDKTKLVGAGIKSAFTVAFNGVKTAVGTAINFVINKINSLIEKINKIPGVNIPIIPKVDWSGVESASTQTRAAGTSTMASYDIGTNRVTHDQVAKIHKDEMIIPAVQSRNLRRQGVTIDNIDKARPQKSVMLSGGNSSSKNLDGLIAMIAQLIVAINNMPKGDVKVFIDGNKSIEEIINELIPLLKLRMANM